MITPITVTNFFEHVNTADTDPAVGICIVKMTGDEHRGLCVVEPGPHRFITAQNHWSGTVIYPVILGAGTIHTGIPTVMGDRSVDNNTGYYTLQTKEESVPWKIPVQNG
jgi:hypothetical protein